MSFVGSLFKGPSARRSRVLGHLDGCEDRTLRGWAIDREALDDCVEVAVVLGEVCLGEGVADLPRTDLRDAGYGDGRHGFTIRLGSVPAQPHGPCQIVVYRPGQGDRTVLGRIDVTVPAQSAMMAQLVLGGVIAASLPPFEAMLSDVRKGISVPETAMSAGTVHHCLQNRNFAASILHATGSVAPR